MSKSDVDVLDHSVAVDGLRPSIAAQKKSSGVIGNRRMQLLVVVGRPTRQAFARAAAFAAVLATSFAVFVNSRRNLTISGTGNLRTSSTT